MYRSRLNDLKLWACASKHKPLIIRGARQVGKTTLVSLFAQENAFELLQLNFERNPEYADFFNVNDPKQIISLLEIQFNQDIKAGKTLLFLDEIQAQPTVLKTLRYFYEEMPDLHIIAAGSLLDFELNAPSYSIPVGRISYMHLHPMGFIEFLLAIGKDKLSAFIQNYQLNDTLPDTIHQALLKQFQIYIAIGGMPEVVAMYAKTGSFKQCEMLKQDLLATFQNDFAKYANNMDTNLIRKVFSKVPAIIGNKVKYSNLLPDYKAARVSRIIDLLSHARLIQKVIRTSANGVPLAAEANHKFFKLIFLDVGLVSSILNLTYQALEADDLMQINSGSLAEQWVGQALLLSQPYNQQPELHYWAREKKSSSAELDYVAAISDKVIGIEVKAGKTGTLKSLHLFLNEKSTPLAIRFSLQKTSLLNESKLLSLPLYFAEEFHRLGKQGLSLLHSDTVKG